MIASLFCPALKAQEPEGGQPFYPELGRLTADKYENYFFNFKVVFPSGITVRRDAFYPIPPRGSHVLLAVEFSGAANTERPAHAVLTVFAEDATYAETTDPRKASNNEATELQKQYKGVKVWGPLDNRVGVCVGAGNSNCITTAFYQSKGYLLKFVTHSDYSEDMFRFFEKEQPSVRQRGVAGYTGISSTDITRTDVLQNATPGYSDKAGHQIFAAANTVTFSSKAPKELPSAAELYTGPAVPGIAIDRAIANPFHIESGVLEGSNYSNEKLHLRYKFPAGWSAMTPEEGSNRFARYHAVEAAPERQREHRFFVSCVQPLLYLKQNAAADDAGDLALFAISPACLGLSRTNWSDRESITALASQLSLLHDLGEVQSAQSATIADHPFLVLGGQLNYAEHKRRSQYIYFTGEGEYMLAWFLTDAHPHEADAFPAAHLELGDVAASNTKQ